MAFYNELNQYATNIAFVDDMGQNMTYGELEEYSSVIGQHLTARSLIFLYCSNTIGTITGYVACLANQVVPVLLKENLEKTLEDNLMDIYCPAYIFLPTKKQRYFSGYETIWEGLGYCLLKADTSENIKIYSELALLLTTSGSTGSPKLVRQSYRNIQSNAESIAQYLELNENERPITTLPMNYTYGLSIINSHLLVGATLLLTERTLMEREFWNFFKGEKASSFGGVPYTYKELKKLRFFKMELPSLRTMTQSGAKLEPSLHKEFAEYAMEQGKHFIVMYGQTEATARIGYLPWQKAVDKYGSMGIAIPGGRLWLKDVKGDIIREPNVVGELVYEGENVTLGYAECIADLAKKDERQGVLETGDLAKVDEDGYFYIVGRKKRFLKLYGNRINLDESERMIKAAFPDIEVVCAGTDEKMYIFINSAIEKKLREVKLFISEKTGINAAAFEVRYLEKIPINESGKVMYHKLEEFYD